MRSCDQARSAGCRLLAIVDTFGQMHSLYTNQAGVEAEWREWYRCWKMDDGRKTHEQGWSETGSVTVVCGKVDATEDEALAD